MSWSFPGQQAFDPVLKQKDHTDSIARSVLIVQTPKGVFVCTHRALKRRKLFDINGRLNPGRFTDAAKALSPRLDSSSSSSAGMTCCSSLRHCQSANKNNASQRANHTW